MSHFQKMTDESIMPHWSKYKGHKLANVPASYLIWLYDEWGIKNSGELHRPLREYIEDNMQALRKEISYNKNNR